MIDNLIVAVIATTILFLLLAGFIIWFILLLQRRRQQHTFEIADIKNRNAQELLKSQLEIQEQTLLNISQEIHDNIGQTLSLAKLQLNSWQDAGTRDELQPTKDLIARSINDLRDLSKSLNPDRIAGIGLVESIIHDLQLLQKTNTLHVHFEVQGDEIKLTPEKTIIVFRIFQELMSNAIRHAEATRLDVLMNYEASSVELSVTDNGKGFEGEIRTGIGLGSMQNRVKVIGATLAITGTLGKGVEANLKVPY